MLGNREWALVLVAAGVLPIFLLFAYVYFFDQWNKTKAKKVATLTKQTEWVTTGRVDFYPESNNRYVLQAEDSREVTSIGGLQHKEIRWRVASLDEAKKVVVKFHKEEKD